MCTNCGIEVENGAVFDQTVPDGSANAISAYVSRLGELGLHCEAGSTCSLAGKVRRNPRAGQPLKLFPNLVEPEFDEIQITAKPDALRTYLSVTGAACFDMEQPLLELLKLSRPGSAAARPNTAPVKPDPPPPAACSSPAD